MSFSYIPFLLSFMAGFSTILGSLSIFIQWRREVINKFIAISLSFAATIMIGICIIELIPEGSLGILKSYPLIPGIIIFIMTFASGIFMTIILVKMIEKTKQNNTKLYQLGILSMIVLMLHNLPEGIITYISISQNLKLGLKMNFAIMCHNIPEGISIAVPIYYSTNSKRKAIFATFLSGFTEILGTILAYTLIPIQYINKIMPLLLIMVSGIMITLAIHELFPESIKYHNNKYIYIGIGGGCILLLINILLI